MSDNNLTMSLKLDLKPFKDGLRGALQLGQEFSRQWQALASGLQVEVDFSSLESVFDEVAKELGDVADEADSAEKEVKELGDETEKTGKKGKKSGQDLLGVLSDLGNAYRGIRQAAMDAYEVLSMPVGKLVEFQSGMSDTNTMLGLTKDQLAGLSDELLKISVDRGIKDLTDLTKGYYNAVSAGRQELGFFDEAAAQAKRGSATLTESISFGVNVLNAWNLATEESRRVFVAAKNGVDNGITTFAELAQNIGQVASTAASAGISLEEVIAANATFTSAGNETSKSMTYMRGAILSLNKALGDGWTETMTFQEGLNKVAEMADGSNTKLLELLGSQEAYAFTVALTGERAAVAANHLEAMYGDTKHFDDALKEKTGITNLRFQLDKLIASFNRLMVKISSDFAPVFGGLISSVKWFIDLLAEHPTIITGVIAAFSTLAITVKALAIKQAVLNTTMAITSALSGNLVKAVVAITAGVAMAAVQTRFLAQSQEDYNEALKKTEELKPQDDGTSGKTIAELQEIIEKLQDRNYVMEEYGDLVAESGMSAEMWAKTEIVSIQTAIERKRQAIAERKRMQDELADHVAKTSERQKMTTEDRLKAELEDAKAYKESLGAITEENYNEHKEAAEKIIAIEHELAREKEAQLQELTSMEQEYRLAAIKDEYERKSEEIEIERQKQLAKAEKVRAGRELINAINEYYDVLQDQNDNEKADKIRSGEEEAASVREDFNRRSLELSGNTYQAQMAAIDQYYASREVLMKKAGITEVQIEEQKEAAKQRVRDIYNRLAIQSASGTLSTLANTAKAFGKKGFLVWKRLAQAQAIVDAYAAANAAFKAVAMVPLIGPVLGGLAAAAALAYGMANVAMIEKQEYAKGGILKGKSHADGGIPIEAEGGEFITRKSRVRELGQRFFDFINSGPIETVRKVVGNMIYPNVPVPVSVGARYADGGVVSRGLSMDSVVDEMRAMRGDLARLDNTVRETRTTIIYSAEAIDPVALARLVFQGENIISRY